MSIPSLQRRELLKGLLATGLAPLSVASLDLLQPTQNPSPPTPAEDAFTIHGFSKNLHFLNYSELAKAAADIGFDGIDLTIRPGGHVEPARVQTDLPRAIDALQQQNKKVLMMTTAVAQADNSADRAVLEAASRQGVRYYRMGWLPYPNNQPIPDSLRQYQQQLTELAHLNQQLNLRGAYQNHAGTNLGSAVLDLAWLLREINHPNLGCQYDIRHATVEGGTSWPVGLRLMQPAIQLIAIKDFIWEKVNGKWKITNVPLGQGMVDFPAYFALLKQLGVRAPISLHFEYPLGGAEDGKKQISIPREAVFAAMRTDLQTLKTLLRQAGLG